jgi:[ribosomal protein S18]-alanine N-acetyltransferase
MKFCSRLEFSSDQDPHIQDDLLAQLYSLDSQFFPYPWDREQWEKTLKAYSWTLTLGIKDEQVVGFILGLGTPEDEVVHLVKILIEPQYRQQGLAEVLFLDQCTLWRDRGHKSVYLEVEERNQAASLFYFKQGFLMLRRLKDFYGQGRDALAMARDLLPSIDKPQNT